MAEPKRANQKLSVKAIIQDQDNWQRYQAAYSNHVSADQMAEVAKRLRCGDPAHIPLSELWRTSESALQLQKSGM